ncbi:hypothetical protein IMZ08_03200 [Bacillus luteolus]|uniref:Uncharacterized protein n=1 Tax=Litchfieldia luteola TaxID=682179 RepID=A0ABR9QF18_9BACI|nr:hypothetical protein [Cytobacillus luteolus]MBE4907063.1 hypothetical protein [Cytobacillus luteolus]MBP1943470.1 hypothetical protein [Cytobacillus luteolus]
MDRNYNIQELVQQSQLSLQHFEENYGQQLAPFQQKIFMIGFALGKVEQGKTSVDTIALKRLIMEGI